jgi:conjugative transfer pilus assembly protein TraH
MLTSIVEKIRSRTPLTEPEIRFVNMTSIPVLKMASVYASQQGVGSDVVLQQYSDVIAIDIAYGWLMNNIRKVEEGANALTGINQDQLTEWRSATAGVRQELLDRQTLVQSKVVAITDIVQRTQAAEQALNAQVKTRLGESLRFSQSLSQ